jgi:hypothetical protein
MKSLNKYREENGLGDIKPTTDTSGPEGELLNDLSDLLKKNANTFCRLFSRVLRREELTTDEENDMKKLIGIIGHLEDTPEEKKKKLRDPLDNVVVRPHNGPDGGGGGDSGGGNGG